MSNNKKDFFSKITQNLSFNKKKDNQNKSQHNTQNNQHSLVSIETHPKEHNLPSEHSNNSNNTKISSYYSPDQSSVSEEIKNANKSDEQQQQNSNSKDLEFSFKEFKTLQEIINTRRSIHSFTSQKPQHKIVYEIIKTAYNAPRAGNITNYHTIIINDSSKIAQISNLSYQQSWMAQAPLLLVIVSKSDEISKYYPDISSRFSTQNTAAYIQNLLLLIHSAGLSSCWVESFQEAIIKDYLGISKTDEIHAILPVGFAKENPKKTVFGDLMMYLNYNSFGEKDPRE